MTKKVYHPLLKRTIGFLKTELQARMTDFFKELTYKRKAALRLGKLSEEHVSFDLKPKAIKQLFSCQLQLTDIDENDFVLKVDQKGVDMKIGLDIGSLAYKKQVDQIILISGDIDFVSAAKHARREGIDFILDKLGAPIKSDLNTHIDGLQTKDDRFLRGNN